MTIARDIVFWGVFVTLCRTLQIVRTAYEYDRTMFWHSSACAKPRGSADRTVTSPIMANEQPAGPSIPKADSDSENTLYKCKYCQIYFISLQAAIRHKCKNDVIGVGIHEPELTQPVENESDRKTLFTCEECEGWFETKEAFENHNSIKKNESLQSDGDAIKGNNWNRAAILLLINEYENSVKRVDKGLMRKKEMWEKISLALKNGGFNFSPDQVNGRWKSLNRAYKNTKDYNKTSGNDRKTYEFENELDRIFGDNPSVTPVVTLSSKRPRAEESKNNSDNESDSKSEPEIESVNKAKKPKSRSGAREVVDLFKSYVESQTERQEKEKEWREKMHEDRMGMMKSLIDAIKFNSQPNSSTDKNYK